MTRPLLLDLFCGAGGAAMGYHRAGFDVIGVDIEPQPNYPFAFAQADAMKFPLDGFDAIHASPPCQGYSNLRRKIEHPRLIVPLRERLRKWSVRHYVIENIEDARRELVNPVRMCGSTFDLNVRRHRWFECSFPVMVPPCQHDGREIRAYYGKRGWLAWTPGAAAVQKQGRKPILRGKVEQAPEDMGIDWMTWDELREAIPPAYTEFIGQQLLAALGVTEGRARTMTDEVIIPTVVCPDCGERISVFAELEHDLQCPGPMRLVFTDDGIHGEPVE